MSDDVVPDLYPGEPAVVRLMNTVWADRAGVHDALSTVNALERWAAQCGLRPFSDLDRADLEAARTLRDAARRLAAAALDDARPGAVADDQAVGDALAVLNRFQASCAPELQRAEGGFRQGWAHRDDGFDQVLATLALETAALLDGGAARLGACHGPGCVLYFARVPARRAWCSEGCGNRARVARHYQRHKAGGA
ncbi:CGNR zinc finger domain-containing protein [Myceligenerans crystallogenes]|uniref:ABATE domain-containing protein n=1 Tax=Myceligenerans crystallogenes TaxID=316335 RepID=A0ABP4ZRI0_9MICO